MKLDNYMQQIYNEGPIESFMNWIKKGSMIIQEISGNRCDVFKILKFDNGEAELLKLGSINRGSFIKEQEEKTFIKTIDKYFRKPKGDEIKLVNEIYSEDNYEYHISSIS